MIEYVWEFPPFQHCQNTNPRAFRGRYTVWLSSIPVTKCRISFRYPMVGKYAYEVAMKKLNLIQSLGLKRTIRPRWTGRLAPAVARGEPSAALCSAWLCSACSKLRRPHRLLADAISSGLCSLGKWHVCRRRSGGAVLTSTDGSAWLQQPSPTTHTSCRSATPMASSCRDTLR